MLVHAHICISSSLITFVKDSYTLKIGTPVEDGDSILKDLGQSEHGKFMSLASGITAHILT